jgi:RNA-directed DNA polymerase
LQGQPDSTEELKDLLPEHLKVNSKGLPGKVFQFRQTLYLKAKREPGFRFYTLYDRICRSDVLRAAWEQVARKDGAPGVDNVSIEIKTNLQQGRREIYDADLQSYFDTIPHENLMLCVQKRIVDSSVLKLIRMWLKAVIVEPPSKDNHPSGKGPKQSPKVYRSKQGTPQGGVISPLLANLYLHWFDHLFHRSDGPYHWANARLVRYADDFVIMARFVGDRIESFVEQTLQGRFDLKVNRDKTRTVKLDRAGQSLDFLGYTFRYDRDRQGRPWNYLNLCPSKKSLLRERDKLREMTSPKQCFKPIPVLIAQINTHLTGWSNYFGHGYPRKAFRQINRFVQERLERHLKRRSQRSYRKSDGSTWYAQLMKLGLRPL